MPENTRFSDGILRNSFWIEFADTFTSDSFVYSVIRRLPLSSGVRNFHPSLRRQSRTLDNSLQKFLCAFCIKKTELMWGASWTAREISIKCEIKIYVTAEKWNLSRVRERICRRAFHLSDARLTSTDISATKIVAKHSAGVPANCISLKWKLAEKRAKRFRNCQQFTSWVIWALTKENNFQTLKNNKDVETFKKC